MRKAPLNALICLVSLSCAGCVSLRVVRVDPEDPQPAKGFRYYMPQPYLLVREKPRTREVRTPVVLDGKVLKGAYENAVVHEGRMEIVYLPDRDREMAVTPKAVLSKQKLNFKLEDGWKLTEVSGEQEADLVGEALAEVMAELIRSSAEVAGTGIQAAAQGAPPEQEDDEYPPIPPGLYRLRVQDDGGIELERVMITWRSREDGKETATYMDMLE